VDDTLVRVMDAALVDRMVEDVSTLAKINVLVRDAVPGSTTGHRVVPFLPVGPADRGSLGVLATEVFERRPGGPAGALRRIARDTDVRVLGRLLSGDGARRGDLLSYLYFDPDFMEASIELGRADAAQALEGSPRGTIPWQVGPVSGGATASRAPGRTAPR
jgi:NTE family protein